MRGVCSPAAPTGMCRENWQRPFRSLTGVDQQSAQACRALAGFFGLSIGTVMPFLLWLIPNARPFPACVLRTLPPVPERMWLGLANGVFILLGEIQVRFAARECGRGALTTSATTASLVPATRTWMPRSRRSRAHKGNNPGCSEGGAASGATECTSPVIA